MALPVQYYLDRIGINSDTTFRLYAFGLLEVLPIGEKRFSQLTLELDTKYPAATPSADQCWIYHLALQLAQQEITLENLCRRRASIADATITYPSLLESMNIVTTVQTKELTQQLATLLNPTEFSLLMKIYRDNLLQKTAIRDLKISSTQGHKIKCSALAKLADHWTAPDQIFTIEPTLTTPIRDTPPQYPLRPI